MAVDANDQYAGGDWYSASVKQAGSDLVMQIKSILDGQFRNGAEVESDEELRARYDKVWHLPGAGRTEAIKSALFALPGVLDVLVDSNDRPENWATWLDEVVNQHVSPDQTVILPPGAPKITIWGGIEQEIINALGRVIGSGTPTVGNITGFYTDKFGQIEELRINRPQQIELYAQIKLYKLTSFRPGMEELIADHVIKYFGGVDSESVFWKGRGIGERVSHAAALRRIMGTRGLDSAELWMGADPAALVRDDYLTPAVSVPFIRRENITFI